MYLKVMCGICQTVLVTGENDHGYDNEDISMYTQAVACDMDGQADIEVLTSDDGITYTQAN